MNDILPSDWSQNNSIIKVVGVGGGGCNAVSYMYNQKIEGCDFFVCNTDPQALMKSPVPNKLKIGDLGAGCNPIEGRKAALNSQDQIASALLDSGTRMLFITAGMGGGTGTGASPVIASMAKERDILTVAVVTLPFENEGNEFLSRAVDGIHELEKCVDSMLIINNEKLYECYGDMLVQDAFPKADEILATAVRGVIEIITTPGFIHVDFKDVNTMMRGSGMALMGCGEGRGENRIDDAIKGALASPLLNDFDLKTAKNVLLNITMGLNKDGLSMTELKTINKKINEYTGNANNFKRGIIFDESPDFGDKVSVTVIATGFKMNKLSNITNINLGNLIVIDQDFVYDRAASRMSGEEIELPDCQESIKIGINDTGNVRKFHFEENEVPVLITEEGQNIGMLETVTAIRRDLKKKN